MNLSDDDKAKVTAGASGAGGVAASVAAVGAAGTVTGFSAAGINQALLPLVLLSEEEWPPVLLSLPLFHLLVLELAIWDIRASVS